MIQTEKLSDNCVLTDVSDPSEEDIHHLKQEFGITDEILEYAYDIDESPRTEYNEDVDMRMVIFDTIIDKKRANVIRDPTRPATFLFDDKNLIVFSAKQTHFVIDMLMNTKNGQLNQQLSH